jgi:integrase
VKAARIHGPPPVRDRVLSDDEVRRVWRTAAATPFPYGPLVQMLFLTGQRRQEISGLRWSEIDLERRHIVIPGERMKAGRPHVVPLAAAAFALLQSLPRRLDGAVFGPVHQQHAKARLDRITGIAEPWVLHDIRRTVRTGLSAAGVDMFIGELVIAHVATGGRVHRVYDKYTYDDAKRRALSAWEERLLTIVGNAEEEAA